MRNLLLLVLRIVGKLLVLASWLCFRVIHEVSGTVERLLKDKLNR